VVDAPLFVSTGAAPVPLDINNLKIFVKRRKTANSLLTNCDLSDIIYIPKSEYLGEKMANRNYDRNRPKYEWGDSWTKKDPTQKQRDYIELLAGKANLQLQNLNQMTRGGASGLIDELKRVVDYGDSTRYLQRDWSRYIKFE